MEEAAAKQEADEAAAKQKDPVDSTASRTVERRSVPKHPGYQLVVPTITRYGDLYFLSGHVPADSVLALVIGEQPSIERQVRSVMDGIRDTLASEHLTMTNIVSVTLYVADIDDLPEIDSVYASYFPSAQPARTVVEVQRLPGSARVQVAVVAGR